MTELDMQLIAELAESGTSTERMLAQAILALTGDGPTHEENR